MGFFGVHLGGGNSNILYFHPECLGKMNPIWRAYFSDGLVQPPTSHVAALEDTPPPPQKKKKHGTQDLVGF